MNKKLIKVLTSVVCGLGIITSIPFISTSCTSSSKPTPIDDFMDITYGKEGETELDVFIRRIGKSELPLIATAKDDKKELDVNWSIDSQKIPNQVKIITTGFITYKQFTSLERYDFVVRATTTDGLHTSTKKFTIVPGEAQPVQMNLAWNDSGDRNYTSYDGKEGTIPGFFSSSIVPRYANQETTYSLSNTYDDRIYIDDREIKYRDLEDGVYTFDLIATSAVDSSINNSLDFTLNIASAIPDDKIIVNDGIFEGIDLDYAGDEKVLYLPESVSSISKSAKDSIPDGIDTIDLSRCDKLTEITDNAFTGKTKIKHVVFPKNVVSITNEAFQDCYALEEVDLSECTSLKSIGSKAFGMTGIKSLKLPGCLEQFDGSAAFWDCNELKEIIWDSLPADGPNIIKYVTPTFVLLPDTERNHGVFRVTNSPYYSSQKLLEWFQSKDDSTKFRYWVAE